MAHRDVGNRERTLLGMRGAQGAWFSWGLLGGFALCLLGCARPQPASKSEYTDRYVHPLSSPGSQFGQLPPAVKHTILAETGSATISRIDKGTANGRTVYRVSFRDSGVFPPLYIAPDGAVLYPNLHEAVGAPQDVFTIATHGPVTRVSLDELPPQVVKAIQRERPEAEVDLITSESRGGRLVYAVTFKGRMHPELVVAPDGTTVSNPAAPGG
ncbi:MAG TPA: hypothetical protein VHI52_08205 [Verrucomicrobiae bacterium]|nr:hypothetical protein [Verrucomicrobiae bacterium]